MQDRRGEAGGRVEDRKRARLNDEREREGKRNEENG